MKHYTTNKFLDGFVFLEGPRWHDNVLWVSDMMAHKVYRISEAGEAQVIATVPERPSGLGFMPDGTPLIVSMLDRRVYKLVDGKLVLHTDASATVNGDLNDMVVDAEGRAYVGNFGYDIFGGGDPASAEIILVQTDGTHRIVADDLECPNGTIISADGQTLVVAESFAGRLTAFDRSPDGSLSNRRVYAEFDGLVPDGMCLDVEGNIWVALFADKKFAQVDPNGQVIATIDVAPNSAIACQLGGADGRSLYCLIYAGDIDDIAQGKPNARIETATVDSQAAGSP